MSTLGKLFVAFAILAAVVGLLAFARFSTINKAVQSTSSVASIPAPIAPPELRTVFAADTAAICKEPFEGGVGEPPFCRIDEPARLKTPFFSTNIDPSLILGLDSDGRRLVMQASIRQSQVVLDLRALDLADPNLEQGKWKECMPFRSANAEGVVCNRSLEATIVHRDYLLRRGRNSLMISLSVSSLGFPHLPLIEQIISSIEVHAL